MKRITFILLTVCLLLSSYASLSQIVKKRGRIVFNDSTQLEGWIDYNDWGDAPTSILFFKDSLEPVGKRYTIFDLFYFEVYGYQAYFRTPLYNECNFIPKRFRNQPRLYQRLLIDTVFFMALIRGRYSLAEYKHNDHSHLQFLSPHSGWIELLVGRRFDEAGYLQAHDPGIGGFTYGDEEDFYYDDLRFRDQLIREVARGNFSDSIKVGLLKRIDKAQVHDIEGIVNDLNQGHWQYKHPDSWNQGAMAYFFVGAGIGYSKLRFPDERLGSHSSAISSLQFGIDLRGSEVKNGLILRAAYGIISYNFPGFYFRSRGPNFSLFYSQLLKSGHRLYAGGTGYIHGIRLSKHAQRKIDSTWLYIDELWMYASCRTGIIMKNHWEIGLEAMIYSEIITPVIGWANPTTINLHITRHFDSREFKRLFSPRSKRKPPN